MLFVHILGPTEHGIHQQEQTGADHCNSFFEYCAASHGILHMVEC
jgi:hypothetical protein